MVVIKAAVARVPKFTIFVLPVTEINSDTRRQIKLHVHVHVHVELDITRSTFKDIKVIAKTLN